jgi:hypothetical protein
MKNAKSLLGCIAGFAILGLSSCASSPRTEVNAASQGAANPCSTSINWFAVSSAYLTPGPGGFFAEQANANSVLARERQEQVQCQLAVAQERAIEAAQASQESATESPSGAVQPESDTGANVGVNMRCVGIYSRAWDNCVGTVHYINGNVYDGEFHHGLRSGYGVLVINAIGRSYASNIMARVPSIYIGEFGDNRMNGDGIIFEEQSHFAIEGTFVDNLPSAPHDEVNCDSNASPATWDECFGVVRYPNGNVYFGQLKNGERSGLGFIKILARGVTTAQNIATTTPGFYVGQFRGGLMNGRGVMLTQASGVFGRFVDNRFAGR